MKTQKVTLKVTIETLSIDVTEGMLNDVISQINAGFECGMLRADDGDSVRWETSRENITF